MRKILTITCLIAGALSWSNAHAQRAGFGIGVQAANDPALDQNVVYRLNDPVAWGFRDTVTVKFYVVNRAAYSLTRIDAKVYWVTDDLKLVALRTGPGWQNANLDFTPQVSDTSLSFVDSGFTATFDSTQAVIEVDFLVDCVNNGDIARVQFRFDSTSRPNENLYFRGSAVYWPGFDDAAITIDEDGWPFNSGPVVSVPSSETVEMGDTLKVPAIFNCAYEALGGVKTGWRWTNRLKFVGVDTVGTLLQGASLTISQFGTSAHDSLWVHTSDSIASEGPDTLFFLVLVDTSVADYVTDTVVNKWDSVFSGCPFLKQGNSQGDKDVVVIPRYTATIDIVDRSIVKNTTDSVVVQLQNNFTVDMVNTHIDSAAAFHVDKSNWTKISWTGAISYEYPVGGRTYRWKKMWDGSDSTIVREDNNQTSNHIPKSSANQHIAWYDAHAGSATGGQMVGFTRIFGSAGQGQDSKLKAYNRPLVIYSFTDTGVDSLFKLATGTVTVWGGGGGGSCPFVYTWGGSDYVLEDAILTESEKLPEGTAVTDYLPLTSPSALENGSYRIRIHEEEAEKTFLDDAELWIIDHEPGFEASVSTEGKVVFGSGRIHPVEVVDEAGKDLTNLLAAEDNQRFEGADNGSLTATFSRREGEIYALSADDSTDWGKDPCEVRSGPLGQSKPEPTTFRIEVEDAQGAWHELPSGPSRLPKTRIRPVIDLSGYDLPALFKLRYTWDGNFSLDEISLSVQVPVEHVLRRAVASGITHSSDHPSAKLAVQPDGRYAELVTGEYLDLEFPAESVPDGMERSLVLMTKGYFLQWFGHEDAARPLALGLNGNYPNPFNPSTTIRYSLTAEALVRLEVFNVLGQRVRTLVADVTQPAGSYDAFWDGTNDGGQFVGSGVYLYRLNAADFVETRKMIMLK